MLGGQVGCQSGSAIGAANLAYFQQFEGRAQFKK